MLSSLLSTVTLPGQIYTITLTRRGQQAEQESRGRLGIPDLEQTVRGLFRREWNTISGNGPSW